MILEESLQGWFTAPDAYFFETLAMFTRTVLEDTYGDMMNPVGSETETASQYFASQTIH
jgi:hypothetical protein